MILCLRKITGHKQINEDPKNPILKEIKKEEKSK